MKNLLYLIIILFIAACSGKSADKQQELENLKKERAEIDQKIAKLEAELQKNGNTKKVAAKDISVQDIQPTTFKNYVEVQGRVDAEQNVQVNPEAMGVIRAIYVSAGQRVGKGQVLAQIDDQVLRQNIAELQTQLELARNLYERQRNLWEQKIGTEVQYLNAKTQKEGLERRMATLRQQAAMYKVTSPIAGTVDQMDWKIGQAVQPGVPGLRVVNANNLKVKAQMAEAYASRVNQGDEVEIVLPDIPDSVYTKLNFVSKVINPTSRSFDLEVKLPSKTTYRPNMLAVLKIVDYKADNAIVVPVKAIQRAENADYVYVVEAGKAKRVNVTTGNISGGVAEITSGLKAGDKVITMGLNDLNEGDPVKF